jgi:CIC family chloride channel protein
MLNSIALDSIINRKYTAVDKLMTVNDFYKVLAKTDANIFPVLKEDGRLEGVVLVDDIRRRLFNSEIANSLIADIMIVPPTIIDYGQPASSVMETFDAIDVWQLPVTKDEIFIGFISKSALLSKYRAVIIEQHKASDLFA